MSIIASYPKARPVILEPGHYRRLSALLLCACVLGILPGIPAAAEAPPSPGADTTAQSMPDSPPPMPQAPLADSVAEAAATPPRDSLAGQAPAAQASFIPSLHPAKWKASSFDLYEIPDRALTEEIWRHSNLAGSPEEGGYQVLLFKDSVQHGYLLRAGTQVGKLPDTSLLLVRRKIRSGALSHGGGSGLWRNFWNPDDPVEPFLWKTGLTMDVRHAITTMPQSSPQLEQHYDMTLVQRPLRWVTMEVGGHMSRYGGVYGGVTGGGLRRNLEDPRDRDPNRENWGERSLWWHAALGIPAVKWEVALSDRLLPEYYWLDPHGGKGSYTAGRQHSEEPLTEADTALHLRDGAVMREWSLDGNPFPRRGNLSQTLHVKLGNIHYEAHLDPEVYRSIIHRAMYEDMPAPFGDWGFGFITAKGAAHTLVRLDLVPWRMGWGKPASSSYFRLVFLRLDIAYRDIKTFHVGASTSLLLDGRAFRPGDKP
jgi:hypothetical protein